MFTASLIPTFGFKGSATDIRFQFTHTHEHADHNQDHDHGNEADVASTKNNDGSHAEHHSHELVISPIALTFIEAKNNLAFAFSPSSKSYPKIQDDKLPLSYGTHSIFRPPISV